MTLTKTFADTRRQAAGPFEPRLLAGAARGPLLDLGEHRRLHGAPREWDREDLAAAAEAVGLLGRGGAAFPVATKLRSTPSGRRSEVVVNLAEGEPASDKDRTLARNAPHLILDGALAVAAALRTRRVTIAVRDPDSARALSTAATRADAAGISIVAARGGFVGGEARALLRGVDGGPSIPPGRRVLPTVSGRGGHPTFLSNAETFAQLGLLVTHGPAWYAEVGLPNERGTTLLTVHGNAPRVGVVEVALGTPLADIVGSDGGPVLIGGYHGSWLSGPGELVLSRPLLRAGGVLLGAGVVARLPLDVCPLAEVAAVARWLADQSTGQCGPCVFGLGAVAQDLDCLLRGRLDTVALTRLRRRVAGLPGRGACAHPDGAAIFIRSALDALAEDITAHLAYGHCGRPYGGILPLRGLHHEPR